MNISDAPDSFVSKIDKKDRSRKWVTQAEAEGTYRAGEERKLQNLIANYLSLHDIYFERDRMDKRTRGKVGRPDFRICYRGRFLAIECKTNYGIVSSKQAGEMARIRKSGGRACVALSLEDVQFIFREIDDEIESAGKMKAAIACAAHDAWQRK